MPSKTVFRVFAASWMAVLMLSLAACGDSAPSADELPNPDENVASCGDGVLDDTEACDDGNLTGGDGCSSACAIEAAPDCGDGLKNQDESDVDCGGSLCGGCADGASCGADGDCQSGVCSGEGICVQPVCGNGILEVGEDCDGNDNLGGATCESAGFKTGTLLCGNDCQFDTGECSKFLQFCNDQGYAIPNNNVSGVDVPITVDSAGKVKSVGISYLKITHTWLDDLSIDLNKGADNVQVMSVGTQCKGDNMEVVVEDAYPAPLFEVCDENNDPAIQGLFRPLTPFQDTFGGGEASGDWVLRVKDLAGADVGTVDSVCLLIEYE